MKKKLKETYGKSDALLGNTALIDAATQNFIEIEELLLNHGADPNVKGKGGYTALITACVVGHYESVNLLIKGGANIDITEERGLKALDFAEDRGYDDIANLLKEAGATRVDAESSPCCWTCVNANQTPSLKKNELACTLDFQNVKVVSRNHLCSAYEKRTD
jgi:ankyrin repeat protein